MRPSWEVFDKLCQRYDEWFEHFPGKNIFELEVKCVKESFKGVSKPWLEVGIGTGRFAEKIGIDVGIDPSEKMLEKAAKRKIEVIKARAENLPFPSDFFGGVAIIVTLCFLDDPQTTLKECLRVLKNDGRVILGIVPRNSSWGKFYLEKKKEGHPFYSVAHFYTSQETILLAERAGFTLESVFSTLFEEPKECENIKIYSPSSNLIENAGFVCIRFKKSK